MTPSRSPASPNPFGTAVGVLLAVVVALILLDAFLDHRPAQGARVRAEYPAASAGDEDAHRFPPPPAVYARVAAPPGVWTDPATIERGRAIYHERCVACHGERGDGRGPDAGALAIKPADMTDRATVASMSAAYWFWRVAEGARAEPFAARGSAMPAWKDALPAADRWAVIAYQHTFSGHRGPHVRAQHPEMARGRATESSR